jgi:antitoxin component YwqK of YwqJK toxin-antitoxin module
MHLIPILEELIVENLLDTFVEKNVGDNKPISNEVFEEIKKVSNGKVNYILWLGKGFINKALSQTDIYKFEEFFPIFEKNKNSYPHKDLNQYKTKADIDNFMKITIEITRKDIDLSKSTEISDNYVSPKDIKRLQQVGIKFHGIVGGYQLFEVPNEAKDNDQVFKRYNEILGKCAGRDVGEKIYICTFNIEQFKHYLNEYPNSSYFVLYNLSDRKSPYQIHYDSDQFMDKDNLPIRDLRNNHKFSHIIDSIQKLYPGEYKHMSYDLLGFAIEKGKYNDQGNLHGEAVLRYRDRTEFGDFVNGEKNGKFITYFGEDDSVKYTEEYYTNGVLDGESKDFYKNGDIRYYNWRDDKLNGPDFTVNANGVVIETTTYEDNKEVGIRKSYYPDGKIMKTYNISTKTTVDYYRNGQPKKKSYHDVDENKMKDTGYNEEGEINYIKEFDVNAEYPHHVSLYIDNGVKLAELKSAGKIRPPLINKQMSDNEKLIAIKNQHKLVIYNNGKEFIVYDHFVYDKYFEFGGPNPFIGTYNRIKFTLKNPKYDVWDEKYELYKEGGLYKLSYYIDGGFNVIKNIKGDNKFFEYLNELPKMIYNFKNFIQLRSSKYEMPEYSQIKSVIDYIIKEIEPLEGYNRIRGYAKNK